MASSSLALVTKKRGQLSSFSPFGPNTGWFGSLHLNSLSESIFVNCTPEKPWKTSRNLAVKSSPNDTPSQPKRTPARLAQREELLAQKTEELSVEDEGPIPQVTEEHVTLSFARSGGPGGQNVNKVNTKVDMRFNVLDATWIPERIRLKIIDIEQNRINSEGELVVTSTKTRTQKGNIEDALAKIQAIIDKAAYVPPPPSEEKKKKIAKLAKAENERRLETKKKQSSKKAERRNKGSWD